VVTEERLILAEEVMGHIRRLPGVRRVYLRGSLAGGTVDRFSDVDVGVDVSGSDNGAFALALADRLRTDLPIEFVDWARSLLPGAYVQSFYLRGRPIFWNVDVDCAATPHVPSVRSVPQDPIDHCLKLWALTAKHCLRGEEGAREEIERLARRVQADESSGGRGAGLMRAVLARLAKTSRPERADFLARCWAVCEEIQARE
jgi:predicted nucleotidyltransferase